MIKIGIVDDSEEFSRSLKDFLCRFGREEKISLEIKCFSSGLNFIEEYVTDYDIVFLDIEMPQMNGMEVSARLREVDKSVDIIFVTVMAQYAVFGYEVGAADYLVKPFNEIVLRAKMQKLIKKRLAYKDKCMIFLKDGAHVKVFHRDIVFVESLNHYCIFHTETDEYKKLVALKAVAKQFDGEGFLRSSSSFLINTAFVTEWRSDSVKLGEYIVPVSCTYRKDFLDNVAKIMGGGGF